MLKIIKIKLKLNNWFKIFNYLKYLNKKTLRNFLINSLLKNYQINFLIFNLSFLSINLNTKSQKIFLNSIANL